MLGCLDDTARGRSSSQPLLEDDSKPDEDSGLGPKMRKASRVWDAFVIFLRDLTVAV